MMNTEPWKVSLHGGHSRAYCDHAFDSLRAILNAAIEFGYHTFGVTEHAPRLVPDCLYPQEREWGWTVDKLVRDFEAYCEDIQLFAKAYEGRLTVLRAFESESVPQDTYLDLMRDYRKRDYFDYCVGSVHFLRELTIDGPREYFELTLESYGGLEPLAIAYYDEVGRMVETLQPEVVAHFDLIRKNGHLFGQLDTPPIVDAALKALEKVRAAGAILDCNTAGYRKGLTTPYPEPWLVQAAHENGIPFCFGDDSHTVPEVGAGLPEAAAYLKENGVQNITYLTRENDTIVKKTAPLP